MRMDKVIQLLATTSGVNSIGNAIETPSAREIFAKKKSVQRSEFYQAMANGLKPELTFEVWTREYQQEQELIFEGKTYRIIRSYEMDDEYTELICDGLVNA